MLYYVELFGCLLVACIISKLIVYKIKSCKAKD